MIGDFQKILQEYKSYIRVLLRETGKQFPYLFVQLLMNYRIVHEKHQSGADPILVAWFFGK